MKAILLFLVVLFTASPSFAVLRSILVEVTVQQNNKAPPTVSIYSDFENEQCLDASLAEAAAILKRVQQPADGVDVSLLVNGWIRSEDLWKLLDALKKNPRQPELIYLEMDRSYVAGQQSLLSEKAKRLQAFFKSSRYTKKKG